MDHQEYERRIQGLMDYLAHRQRIDDAGNTLLVCIGLGGLLARYVYVHGARGLMALLFGF